MKSFILALFIITIYSCKPQVSFDKVLQNGLIYDGGGGEPYLGDIGMNADTIAAIGKPNSLNGKEVVSLNGNATAPGFINMLSWANVTLLEDGRSQSDIRQGVTLEVLGEGRSMGPLNEKMKTSMKEGQVDIKYDIPWTTLGEYLQHLEDKGVSTNVASFVGNGTLRTHVIGFDNRPATEEEMVAMKLLTKQAMEEGAVGISSSLLYAPSMYANTEELIELAKVVSEYDGMYISHIRNEGDRLIGKSG